MKALSVNQPWAWLIVEGYKPVENRDWDTKHRGRIMIHAGIREDKHFDYERWEAVIGRPIPRNLPKGGIVGEANLVGVARQNPSPFFFGKYGFLLIHPMAYTEIRPCVGKLGFFTPDFNSKYKEKTK